MSKGKLLTKRFELALVLANKLHDGHYRKQTRTPYISHLISVAALVLEHGGTENEAIAALLHDAVEDRGGLLVLRRIKKMFGEEVAGIVEHCTEPTGSPKPPWKTRKLAYIGKIASASPSVRLVACADKVHNIRSILSEHRWQGDVIWKRFRAGKKETLWFYRAVSQAFFKTGESRPIFHELACAVVELEEL